MPNLPCSHRDRLLRPTWRPSYRYRQDGSRLILFEWCYKCYQTRERTVEEDWTRGATA